MAHRGGGSTPPGIVLNYAGKNPPSGWLICDGRAVSRTTYSDLFKVIGTTYGNGDGKNTFNLPNLINRFIEGGIANQLGTYYSAGLPNITGTFEIWKFDDYTSSAFTKEYMGRPANSKNGGSDAAWKITLDASKSNSIYGKSNTVQPEALSLLPIIKY